jgi:hypothetical protein
LNYENRKVISNPIQTAEYRPDNSEGYLGNKSENKTDTSLTPLLCKVKSGIKMYIDLYGFPKDGVFDVNKLSALR